MPGAAGNHGQSAFLPGRSRSRGEDEARGEHDHGKHDGRLRRRLDAFGKVRLGSGHFASSDLFGRHRVADVRSQRSVDERREIRSGVPAQAPAKGYAIGHRVGRRARPRDARRRRGERVVQARETRWMRRRRFLRRVEGGEEVIPLLNVRN